MFRFVKTLLWKSWCIRKRHYIITFTEIFTPIGLFMLLLYLKSTGPSSEDHFVGNTTYPSYTKEEIIMFPLDKDNSHTIELAYAPDSDVQVNNIMDDVNKALYSRGYTVDLIRAANESEVSKYFYDRYGNSSTFGLMVYGIIFSTDLSYTLRPVSSSFQTDILYPGFTTPGPGLVYKIYLKEGFVPLQIVINDAICKMRGFSTQLNFNMTEFPYPAYNNFENFKLMYSVIIPMLTMFGYYSMVPNLISNVIQEKNSGSREWMGMVGIPRIMILISWVLHALPLYFVTNIICCCILIANIFGSPVVATTNIFFIWLVLFLFCTCTVVFLLAITSFINNPNVAVIFGSFVWILPSISASFYQYAKNVAYAIKVLTCLSPSCALNWAFSAISGYEANRDAIRLTNIFNQSSGQNEISLGVAILFLFGTIFLYGFLFLYIDAVKPGRYGRARSWYFPFSAVYKSFVTKNEEEDRSLLNKKKNTFEDVSNLPVGLGFHGIKKHFGNVIAVDDVTIDIYKGQITALLGHNGAGKTTLINIITGMFSPTKGKIWRDGKNVFDNFSNFQMNLGLCPQHDLLFPYLNVIEHVMFFGMLRGLSRSEAVAESKELLKFFGISDKENCLSKKLSGGMKRKLSLAISLVGKPEILILDEPTSGMDPESRRDTWNKLLNLRGDRTIILTTHYMEEADVLGDMIAIMDHGNIKCYGTSLFLKRHYGSGYKVTLPLEDQETVTEIMKSFIPEVMPLISGPQVSFSLPLEKSHMFSNLFSALENKLPKTSRFSVACTTLDDVFLKVANKGTDEIDNVMGDEDVLLGDSNRTDEVHSSSEALTPKPLSGFPLFRKRLFALFVKKLLYNYHRWASWFFLTILYPFFIFLIPLSLTSAILKGESSNPSLAMDLNIYGTTGVIVSSSSATQKLSDSFVNLVQKEGSTAFILKNSTSVEEALLNYGTQNLPSYRHSYIVAADMLSNIPNLFYSSIGIHSPAIAVNMLYKSWIATVTGGEVLDTHNHPFSFRDDFCSPYLLPMFALLVPSIWLFTAPLVLAVISFSFSRLHHDERLNDGKLLQLMTGTSPVLYWLSAYLCDFVLFLISSLLILLWAYIFDTAHLFSSFYDFGVFLLILLMACTGNTWFGYLMSYFLRTFSRLFSFNMFIAFLVGQVAYFILDLFRTFSNDVGTTVNFFHHIFMFYPTYCSSALIFKFIKMLAVKCVNTKCNKDPDHVIEEPSIFTWDDDGINQELVYITCDCILFACLIFLTDYKVFGKLTNFIFNKYAGPLEEISSSYDADVENERSKVEQAVRNIHASQSSIIVDRLGKKYSRNVTAVKDVSFLIPKGECFGLLGVNGAGKSTTFKMLTGDLLPSVGQAVLFGDSLLDSRLKYQSHIGYCPQTDAIIEALTATEMLNLYASLRGVHSSVLNRTISFWISEFGLQGICNRKCESYSGGNKRKLSTAISLIGDPQVVFLDEPTTGVDPVARRKFWAILSKLQKRGCTIILTSHSMDECETVCDRLTIMVKGEMKCIGNIQRLKEIYGQGYTIMIQIGLHNSSDLDNLKLAFKNVFNPHAILRDEHLGLLHYHVNCPDYKWSTLFSTMERLKESHPIIKEYGISETTLEQIFLHFAKM